MRPGDSVTVDCVSSDGRVPVQWKREGNQALPHNIRVSNQADPENDKKI